tara:strand:+ start:24794 stop:25522 length:729 start_codon:yes stop_codon:yes gene_type:complete
MFRPSSIDEFKSLVGSKRGAAKTNLYHVQLPAIQGADSPRNMSFLCTSVTLPSRQILTAARDMGVDQQQVAYGFQNPEVSMTFRVMNDQSTRRYFEGWMDSIIVRTDDLEGRYVSEYADNYCFPLHIYQLEKGFSIPILNKSKDVRLGPININLDLDIDAGTSGFANYHWLLDRAYPKSVSYETFSDGASNEISQFTVEFTYKSWQGEVLQNKDKGKVGITATGAATTGILNKLTNSLYNSI